MCASYHHGDLAAALVQRSLELVDAQGSDEFSLRQAARDVGVSASAAYRHFADREVLLRATSAAALETLGSEIDAAVAGRRTPTTRALALGLAYLEHALRHPDRFRLMFGPLGIGHPDGVLGAPPEGPRPQRAFLAVASDLGGEPMEGAIQLWVTIHGVTALAVDGPLSRATGKDPQSLMRMSVRAAVDGLARRGRPTGRRRGASL